MSKFLTYENVQEYQGFAGSSEKLCQPRCEALSGLNSWLRSRLDRGSFQGQFTIQFREARDEGFELRLGDE